MLGSLKILSVLASFSLALAFFGAACQINGKNTIAKQEVMVTEISKGEALSSETRQTALLAGGCFWGMEEIIRKIPGVLNTTVGYTGGQTADPRYDQVKWGGTGHAESIEVVFDPKKIGYEQLLGYFFRMHDPTTQDRQGNDRGSQYRSAIFYLSEEQKKTAEQVKQQVNRSGKWKAPIVTEIVPAAKFYPAEAYHQDYLKNNPEGYTCHYLRD